jgi:hypothetical protein
VDSWCGMAAGSVRCALGSSSDTNDSHEMSLTYKI